MKRREVLLATAALAVPAPLLAQALARKYRVGFLGDGTSAARAAETLEPFRLGLEELGYVVGRNLVLEVRWSNNDNEQRIRVAQELVKLNPDVIVTHGNVAPGTVHAASQSVPIVIAVVADVMATGLVASLARPGGSVTGMTDLVAELAGKEVELLKEILPAVQRIAVLWDSGDTLLARSAKDMQAAASKLGMRVQELPVRSPEDFEPAFGSALKGHSGAVIVIHSPLTVAHRNRIAQLAIQKRLPLISAPAQFTSAGGLMSYGPDLSDYFRRAARYVDKILRGEKPGDIPVEQATRFELVVNKRTAQALGIEIPKSILLRADRVIE